MKFQHLGLAGLVTSAVATNLYVSSYIGTVNSLQLSQNPKCGYSLIEVAVNNGSAPNPSYLTKNEYSDVVYCANEGLSTPNGSITTYKLSQSGILTEIDNPVTVDGPVSQVVYNGGKGLAAAH